MSDKAQLDDSPAPLSNDFGSLINIVENGVLVGQIIHWPGDNLIQFENAITRKVTNISTAGDNS